MGHATVGLFTAAVVATLFLTPRRRTLALFLASFLGLVLALVAASSPRLVGDTGEYLAMALNLGRLSPPSLSRPRSSTRTGGSSPAMPPSASKRPRLRAADGRQDFPHFWFYSLVAAPLVRAVQAVGANPLDGFSLLNVVLLVGLAALLGVRASPAIALFVAGGPVLWWVDKAHTEVFTSVMLAAALLLLRTSPWWSILALGAASRRTPSSSARSSW